MMSEAIAAGTLCDYDAWAEFYDLTEGDRSAPVFFYQGLVTAGVRNLIDLGCGTGVITMAMARVMDSDEPGRQDIRVVGIDSSARMLAIARARAPEFLWCVGDIRQPPTTGRFDLITCCYNTLQFLPDENAILHTMRVVRDLLAPQGRFAFDLFQPNWQRLRIPKRDRLLREYRDLAGRQVELREDTDFDEKTSRLTVDWRLVAGGQELGSNRLFLRQYPHATIQRILEVARLRIVECYGDYDRRPFDVDSMRQVLVCAAT